MPVAAGRLRYRGRRADAAIFGGAHPDTCPDRSEGAIFHFVPSPDAPAGDGGKAPRPEDGKGVAGPAQRAQPYLP